MLAPVVFLFFLLMSLSAVAAGRTAPGLVPVKRTPTMDGIALPLVSFSSDQGFGYGAVGGMYLYGDGSKTPYAHALSAQVFFSSRGAMNHYLRYDGPQLLGPLRLEGRLEYRQEKSSPFFGAGNLSAPDFRGDVDDQRYNYDKGSPGLWVRLRGRPFGDKHPFQSYVGYGWRYTRVSPYETSILAQERPIGIEGGPSGQLLAGALWDTRDDESDPTSGGVEEVALRVSGLATFSRYQYAGVTLSERRYIRITPRLIFAQRLTLDMLFGEVPFFEWMTTGGVNVSEGIGGMSSVRGIERNRFAGNVKAFSNSELRFQAARMSVLGQPLALGAVVFLDLGRVWHPGVTDGKWHEWHPGIGGGLRFSRRAAVVRMDYARSTETGRQRFYITFGHMF
ncbi:outer membrane protein assembly factor [Corallococcus interemptor]|uniref:Omp85 family outer membrane protein n=1 Tax=Corallococcus TaxID=83461 RepID=UPI001CBF92DE|nr:BamA/TamA family outer membrane protein [Corallococcus sp. AS-1-12]MBZ4333258.1 outer membrane protein assembly factor [Corallococcus sp. AS-1-12]